jgi:hypothetical protein
MWWWAEGDDSIVTDDERIPMLSGDQRIAVGGLMSLYLEEALAVEGAVEQASASGS